MNVRKDKLSSLSKEKLTKYETIFDHTSNEEELKHIVPEIVLAGLSKEEYINALDQDTHFLEISELYLYRNDEETAEKYYLMVSEKKRLEMEKREKTRIKA